MTREPAATRGLPAEVQALFLAAGGTEADERLRALLARPLDWTRLCRLAVREQAVPVLWDRVVRAGAETIPGAEGLRRLAMVARFRARHLERSLHAALDTLAAANIEAVLLKGAAVAHTAYGDFARRPMGDLDILVRADRGSDAFAALRRAGWTVSDGAAGEEFYRNHQHLPPLDDPGGTGVGLDLHTELFRQGHPFGLRAESVWDAAQSVEVAGRRVAVPDPEHQLLHACLHFAWSHSMKLGVWRTIRDVAALDATGRIDWTRFAAAAAQSRGATCCYWTLRLARALAGSRVPEQALALLRPPGPESAHRRIERHFALCVVPSPAACPSVRLGRFMWEVGVRPLWSGHGSARPWSASESFAKARHARPDGGTSAADRVARNAGTRCSWSRYARQMLGSAALPERGGRTASG